MFIILEPIGNYIRVCEKNFFKKRVSFFVKTHVLLLLAWDSIILTYSLSEFCYTEILLCSNKRAVPTTINNTAANFLSCAHH